jgi:hypothetical protein
LNRSKFNSILFMFYNGNQPFSTKKSPLALRQAG